MKKIFPIICIILILSSCTTTRLERQEARRHAKCEKYGCYEKSSDSLMILKETITIRQDTTIYIHLPGMIIRDTAIVVEKNPTTGLMNSKKSILQAPFATSYAWVENGKLKHELFQKDSVITEVIKGAKWLIKENTILKEKSTVKPPPERVNYISGWQWFQIWLGRLVIGFLLLLFMIKIIIPKFVH